MVALELEEAGEKKGEGRRRRGALELEEAGEEKEEGSFRAGEGELEVENL